MTISSRVAAVMMLAPMTLQSVMAQADGAYDAAKRQFDLIVRSEITIDRSAQYVWPYFLDMDAWMTDNRFQSVAGRRGEEGELRRVTPRESTPYSSYLIKTVRATPFERYVITVAPENGNDYFGFASFSFTETHGKTHIIYDIYVELTTSGMSAEAYRQFCNAQYTSTRRLVARNNQNLKVLVEMNGRNPGRR